MVDVSERINSTLSFSNYTSPYSPSVLRSGLYSANHTTTVDIAWTPATLLTPWPYLGASMALSLLLCMWAVITNLARNLKRVSTSSRRIRAMTTNGALIFFTFRAVIIFVNGVKAMQTDQDARAMPPTALGLAVLSMAAYIAGTDRHAQRLLLFGDILLVLTVFEMMFFNLLIGSDGAYGQWVVTGGNCPIVVRECPIQLFQVGCGIEANKSNDIKEYKIQAPFGPNKVGTGELSISAILNFAGVLILASAYFAFWWLSQVLKMLARLVQGDFSDFHHDKLEDDVRGAVESYRLQNRKQKEVDAEIERRDWNRWLAIITVVAILAVAAIAIPLHYAQQTKSRNFTVLDGFGPVVDYQFSNDLSHPDTFDRTGSWSDCFEVSTPVDHLGFFEYWWETTKGKPLAWLAVV